MGITGSRVGVTGGRLRADLHHGDLCSHANALDPVLAAGSAIPTMEPQRGADS